MKEVVSKFKANPELIFRIVLFLAFFGHGLVSLGFSSSIKLHYGLIESVNITLYPTETLLLFAGWFDLIISFLILFKIGGKYILYLAITYLSAVGITAAVFYFTKTGEIFGIAEIMRRFPWIIYSIFLVIAYQNKKILKLDLLRVGLAFAFLSHGLASLGIWGLNAGHIELANNILKAQDVQVFIMASGFTDTIIGVLLMTGILSQSVAKIALLWIVFIVSISFMTGIPDGIFRSGFLLSALYVALEEKCHSFKLLTLIKK